MFSLGVCLGVIDDKGILLLFQKLIKVPEFFSLVEEDDDLEFVLEFAEFLQNVENDFVLVGRDGVVMRDTHEALVLVFGV